MIANSNISPAGKGLRIAFFDYPDVFEDFYPHYGVDQKAFSTTWQNTANHQRIALIQREIGEVIWYVTCLNPEFKEPQQHKSGFRVRFLPSSWLHRQLWRLFYLPSFSWRWRGAYRYYATLASYLAPLSWSLIRSLYRDRPDFIFTQDYCSGRFDVLWLLAKMFRTPLVTIHTGSTADHYLGKRLKPFTISRTERIFASGARELERLKREYRIPESRLSIVRSPIQMNTYRPLEREAACRSAGLDPHRRYLLFMGRLDDSVKRISAIIEVFGRLSARHSDLDLLLAGNGQDESKLRMLAEKKARGRIHFLGWVGEAARKAQLYNAAACLVLASWREGFPAVVGEAFACGTPVVSSDVGTISDVVIEGQTGWLFPPGDDEAMYRKLSLVAGHPEISAALRPRVRQFAEQHLSEAAVTEVLKRGFLTLKKEPL